MKNACWKQRKEENQGGNRVVHSSAGHHNGNLHGSVCAAFTEMKTAYPTTACGEGSNASNKLRESLCIRVCHLAERQQLVDNDKTTIKKLGFDAVAIVVQEPRVLYLHTS